MRGGYREGAGRRQGFAAKKAEEAREILAGMVISEIVPIGEALIAKAKAGDVSAIKELLDRAFGKAPQTNKIDITETVRPVPILGGLTFDSEFKQLPATTK